jgi:hypothetical protein
VSIQAKLFKFVLFLGSLGVLLASQVGVVLKVFEFGSGDGVHLDRPEQASLLREVVELVVEPAHIIGRLALLPPLAEGLHHGFMLCELGPAGTSPGAGESAALLAVVAVALPGEAVVLLEGVLAETLEVIGAVGGDIVEAAALALGGSAGRLLASGGEVVMIFKLVVAEALGLRANHLAVLPPLIAPTQVQSVLGLL